ncbi:cytochrome P450 20A1-like [Actinia tenebrosa]|uniref:Cytochrome P450 20A1-like n=1 Tax=Actinia tenebrosa TaxID=6105 RepID=A0A6P8J5B6_ACTTE|nr:cytochrome P450 20A1-like [Actinia tenebrosa]
MFPSHLHVADFGIFAVVAVFALIVILLSLFDFRKSAKGPSIPGPGPSNPESGNLDDVKKAGSLHEYMVYLHDTYGKIVGFWWGETYTVSVACPYLWKDIQGIFDRPRELFKLFEPLIGKKSIQYKNGPKGRQLRQVTDRSFSHEAVMNYYDCILETAKEMEAKWESLPKGEHIPLEKNMIYLAVKSMGLAGLGKTFRGDKESAKFIEAYETCWQEMEAQLGTPPPTEGSDRHEKFEEGRKIMRSTIKDVIKARKNMDQKTDKLFIDSMIEYDQIDQEELEDDILTFMIGGFHTTGNMMIWCFYYLALHPEVQEKVYQELIEVLGEEDIVPAAASQLKYCRQVIDETLRCSILAPWGARVQMDHDLQIGDHVVPKETPIMIPFGVVLHDPEIFPEPQRFDPDRFSPENAKDLPSLAFQPFGFAGKRKCPGWRFSITEGLVFLSVFIRRFKVELVAGQKVQPVHRLVTSPNEEVWITINKR